MSHPLPFTIIPAKNCLVLVFGSAPPRRFRLRVLHFTHNFVTHKLSHTTLSHTTLSRTTLSRKNCHNTHTTWVTYKLSHTTLSHTQLCHTQLCHTQIVTHNFGTYKLSHTTLSHTNCHTQLCYIQIVTHNFVTYNFVTYNLATSAVVSRSRHGTWRHPPPFHVAGVALGDIRHRFTWQGWHLVIHRRFAWQAWHFVTSTFVLRDRRDTFVTGLASCGALGARCGAAATLRGRRGSLATSTFVLRGRLVTRLVPLWRRFTWRGKRGTWWHPPSFLLASVTLVGHGPGSCVARLAPLGLRGTPACTFALAGVALGVIDASLGVAGVALWWHPPSFRHGRRGTYYGTGLGLVARLGPAVVGATLRDAGVALVALGDICRRWGGRRGTWRRATERFAWHAWHLWRLRWLWVTRLVTQYFVTAPSLALVDIYHLFYVAGWCRTWSIFGTAATLPHRRHTTLSTSTIRFVTHTHNVYASQALHMYCHAHHLSHRTLSHTIFLHTPLSHTIFVTHPRNFVKHHLYHTPSLSHTIFPTQLCHTHNFVKQNLYTTLSRTSFVTHTISVTHIFVRHHLSHTLCHTLLCHTKLCHTKSLSHTTLSHTIFVTHNFVTHTQLCHTHNIVTHHLVTHHLSHTSLSDTIFHTHNFVTHNFVTHHLCHTQSSYKTLSHTIFHTHLCHHHLSHTSLLHTIFHTHLGYINTIFHTHLGYTPSLPHTPSSTHTHTTFPHGPLSHTIFHTQPLHIQPFHSSIIHHLPCLILPSPSRCNFVFRLLEEVDLWGYRSFNFSYLMVLNIGSCPSFFHQPRRVQKVEASDHAHVSLGHVSLPEPRAICQAWRYQPPTKTGIA